MKKHWLAVPVFMVSIALAAPAHAWSIWGLVRCDVELPGTIDSSDNPLPNVQVTVTGSGFSGQALTDSNGYYQVDLPDVPGAYSVTIGPGGLPGDALLLLPAVSPYPFATTDEVVSVELNWLVASQTCRAGGCWLTGGGVKFDPVLGMLAGERGPKFSFGGNTYPGCSPTAGDGGQWNFVDHSLKLHFQGWSIDRVVCGNVPGIPPGSTSPATPYNYIEFSGTGTLKGISGNRTNVDPVYFFVRAEDRNEPGNEKALLPGGGAQVDRLFLRVYTSPADPPGSTLYLLDADGNPATMDPVTITGGNLQLHVSSCP